MKARDFAISAANKTIKSLKENGLDYDPFHDKIREAFEDRLLRREWEVSLNLKDKETLTIIQEQECDQHRSKSQIKELGEFIGYVDSHYIYVSKVS